MKNVTFKLKHTLLSVISFGIIVAQSALASSGPQYPAEYVSESIECTVMEVATQFESGSHAAEFHCAEEAGEAGSVGGRIFKLEGLPTEFEDKYRGKLNSIKERLAAFKARTRSGYRNQQSDDATSLSRKARKAMRATLRASKLYRSQDTLILTEGTEWSMTEDAQSINEANAETENAGVTAEAISVVNESNVLILHITALDAATSASPSELSDSVFGTFGDAVNLASQYDACSYGKKTFVPAEGDNIVDGVAQITIDINAGGASRGDVQNAATSAATALLGNLSSQFDHVMYAVPAGTTDNWIAYGYFNYYQTVYNNDWVTKVSAQMHEVGHNLYLQHSSEGSSSYGDQQGMMGYSYSQDDGPVMCFNAAKSSQLSWYSDKEVEVNQSWSGKVIGLADYDAASSDQQVILKGEGADNSFIYVTYNRKAGINSGTKEAGDLVTIVRGANRQTSSLLAKLAAGGNYTLADFWGPGEDFTLTVDEIGTDFNNVQYAQVSIGNGEEPAVYALVVNNGSGDGNYSSGDVTGIAANTAPSGQEFDRWVVNSGGAAIANVNAASTTLTMASNDATVTATYKDQPAVTYTLTVTSGSGDGSYVSGAVAAISANSAPSGQIFDRWTVVSGGASIANANAASTTLTMPANAATVRATYKNLPAASSYTLTVNSGNGDGSYVSDAAVNIRANTPPSGQQFDRWVVNSGGATISNVNAASTTLIMPSNAATVTATYADQPAATYPLTVNNGSGDGSYASGAVTGINADAAPSGQTFNRWVVDSGSAVIANINAASTTLTMGSTAATVSAQYKEIAANEPKAEQGVVTGVSSSSWTTVNLSNSYSSMVVVATPNYAIDSVPAVTRIRNASGSSFQVKMSVAAAGTISNVAVHYLVVEEGVYESPRMEARKVVSNDTNGNSGWGRVKMEPFYYANSYNKPVVLGQVMTHNDADFSIFFASRGSRKASPTAASCYVGKHVAEDPDTTRSNETLGVIVIEKGSGILGGVRYSAALGPKTVAGVGNSPAYAYPTRGISNPANAILSTATMKGANGGWPILYGNNPVSAAGINTAVDEDTLKDSERVHGLEKLSYIVFDSQ